MRPDLFQYANAIGAAISQTSGEIDRVFSYENSTREKVVQEAIEMSRLDAIRAGAVPETVKVVEVDQIPMSYVSANALRIRVKTVGTVDLIDGLHDFDCRRILVFSQSISLPTILTPYRELAASGETYPSKTSSSTEAGSFFSGLP